MMQTATAFKAPLSVSETPTNPKLELAVWPAPGGGLLLSAHLAAYGGAGVRARANIFLSIPTHGTPSLMAPYIEPSRRSCDFVTDIVCDELRLANDGVIFTAASHQCIKNGPIAGDIMLSEWKLRGLAAVARHLLLAEASDALPSSALQYSALMSSIGVLAVGASLQPVPTSVVTRCGRNIDVIQELARSTVINSLAHS
jgi:hypothetical protein